MFADRPQLYVALDMPAEEALELAARLGDAIDGVKIGSTLFTTSGPDIVDAFVARGQDVFLDLKFHDIPHQVGLAVAAGSRPGVRIMTIHASGGPAMCRAAADAAGSDVAIVAVTVLTSMDQAEVEATGGTQPIADLVNQRVRLAQEAGLDGVVASAREAGHVRTLAPRPFLLVTPGIRPQGAARGDQARAVTPLEAVTAGSDVLVVGRPITLAEDPVAAARAIRQAMGGG
jgi:orotidine-5'-phosphate decarboxylase